MVGCWVTWWSVGLHVGSIGLHGGECWVICWGCLVTWWRVGLHIGLLGYTELKRSLDILLKKCVSIFWHDLVKGREVAQNVFTVFRGVKIGGLVLMSCSDSL